jgi:hypothetical protein
MTVPGIHQATSYTQAMVIEPGSGAPASAEASAGPAAATAVLPNASHARRW